MSAKVQVLSIEGDILTIDYQKIGKKIKVDLSKLPHREHAYKYGWKQRLGDLKSGDETGNLKHAEVLKLLDHLKAGGDWNMSGERDTVTIVVEALVRIDKVKYPREKLLKAVEANPDLVKEWRTAPKIKAMIAKIYAERAEKAAEEMEDQELDINLK